VPVWTTCCDVARRRSRWSQRISVRCGIETTFPCGSYEYVAGVPLPTVVVLRRSPFSPAARRLASL
jgi:hypothetical protein